MPTLRSGHQASTSSETSGPTSGAAPSPRRPTSRLASGSRELSTAASGPVLTQGPTHRLRSTSREAQSPRQTPSRRVSRSVETPRRKSATPQHTPSPRPPVLKPSHYSDDDDDDDDSQSESTEDTIRQLRREMRAKDTRHAKQIANLLTALNAATRRSTEFTALRPEPRPAIPVRPNESVATGPTPNTGPGYTATSNQLPPDALQTSTAVLRDYNTKVPSPPEWITSAGEPPKAGLGCTSSRAGHAPEAPGGPPATHPADIAARQATNMPQNAAPQPTSDLRALTTGIIYQQAASSSREFSPVFPQQPTTDETSRHTQDWAHRDPPDHLAQIASVMKEAFRARSAQESSRSEENDAQIAALIARQSTAKDLPLFSGDPLEWPTWLAQYRQSTATCKMTRSENLIRLQRALTGRAKESVHPLLMDPAQVDEIITVLDQRFGGPDTIATLMLEKAKRLPCLSIQASWEELKDFSGTVQNLVRSLQLLKTCGYLTNPALLHDMTAKLPVTLQLQWLIEVSFRPDEGEATIAQFAAFLRRLSTAIPRSGLRDPVRPRTRRELVHTGYDEKIDSDAVLTNNNSNLSVPTPAASSRKRRFERCARCHGMHRSRECPRPDKRLKTDECAQCAGRHHISECPVFANKTPNLRWETVRLGKLCRKCLDCHHTRFCTRNVICDIGECRIPHHRLLHNPDYIPGSTPEAVNL